MDIRIVGILVTAPIETAEKMVVVDFQNWFLFVVDIHLEAMIAVFEAVADLARTVGYRLVVLEMVVGVALAARSQYFFLSINIYAREIAWHSIIIKS